MNEVVNISPLNKKNKNKNEVIKNGKNADERSKGR